MSEEQGAVAIPEQPPLDDAARNAALVSFLGSSLAGMVLMPVPADVNLAAEHREWLRGLILARKKDLWVPDGANLVEFVLTEALKRAKAAAPPPPGAPAPSEARVGITISGSYYRHEYGRCTFSRKAYYSGRVLVTDATLRRILAEARDRDDAESQLQDWVEENEEFGYDESDDEETDDHDVDGDDGRENVDLDVHEVLETYLAHHPELDPERGEDEGPVEVEDEEEEPEEDEEDVNVDPSTGIHCDVICDRCGHRYGDHTSGTQGPCTGSIGDNRCACPNFQQPPILEA